MKTLDEQLEELRSVRPREFDAMVNLHVHACKCARCNRRATKVVGGLPFCGRDCDERISNFGEENAEMLLPEFATDAAADYETLRMVRKTWDERQQTRVHQSLGRLWAARSGVSPYPCWPMRYEPGDYSHAALAVVIGERGGLDT